jgi:hypothetical protein
MANKDHEKIIIIFHEKIVYLKIVQCHCTPVGMSKSQILRNQMLTRIGTTRILSHCWWEYKMAQLV